MKKEIPNDFKWPDCDTFDLRIEQDNLNVKNFMNAEFEGIFSLEYVNNLLRCFGFEGTLQYGEEYKNERPKISLHDINATLQCFNKDYRLSFNRELNDNLLVITGFDIRRGFYIDGDYCTELVTTVNFKDS